MYGALAHGFGLDLGLGGWLLLEGIGNLALAVPASAAGIGSFDYLTLLGARSLGVSAGAAGAYVLTVHALVVLPATLLGGLLARSAFRGSGERERGTDGRAAAGRAFDLEPAAERLDAVEHLAEVVHFVRRDHQRARVAVEDAVEALGRLDGRGVEVALGA